MSDEPNDIKLAASLVCSFLKGQANETEGSATVSFNKGVVAFARRVGENAVPQLFVQPIAADSLSQDILRAICLGRDPNSTGHFSTVKPEEEWGFSLSLIDQSRKEKTISAKGKLQSDGIGALDDHQRNALDLECFSSDRILRVPVSFLASPLLVCYFDYAANGESNATVNPDLKKRIFNRVVSPLSNLLATHIVLQLSQIARELIFADILDVKTAQKELIREAAGLLWAKSATFDSTLIVQEEEPLKLFLDGVSLSKVQSANATRKLWEIKLPAFKTFIGEQVGNSTELPGVDALRQRIEEHVDDLLALLHRAAQWWEQERAVTATQMVGQIENDLRELLRHTEAARRSALRVEMVLTPSREDFLKHYDELRRLFDEKQSRWYGTKTENGKTKCTGVRVKESECKENGFSASKIETVHSAENVEATKWNTYYKPFLDTYGKAENIELFQQFKSVAVNDEEDENARRLFRLLKLMVQRPHASPDKLFGLQMAVSCATAWHGQTGKDVIYQTEDLTTHSLLQGEPNQKKALHLSEALKIEEDYLSDRDQKAYRLASLGTCTQLLGSIMQLIKLELIQRNGKEDVHAQKVTVRHAAHWLEVAIECHGCFGDPEKNLSLTDTSTMRGLRALVENFCRATGQSQPYFVETIEEEYLRAARKRFLIGSNPSQNKTVWFMSFPPFAKRTSSGTTHFTRKTD